MKNVMNKIKKNKLLILFLLLVILVTVFLVKILLIFSDSDEVAIYGERLTGDEVVTIDSDEINQKIKKEVSEQTDRCKVRIQGRIVNIILSVKADVSRDTAKELASATLEKFSKKEKSYYDFQIYLNKEAESEDKAQFPIIGYKHHTKDNITWTKDR